MQRHRQRGLLHRASVGAIVFGGQFGKAEFLGRRAFPEEVEIDLGGHFAGLPHHLHCRRLGELQQHILGLDLGALARRQLDLVGLALLGEHGAGADFAAFFEQQLHWIGLSEVPGKA
jgi:hypothetical protein